MALPILISASMDVLAMEVIPTRVRFLFIWAKRRLVVTYSETVKSPMTKYEVGAEKSYKNWL